MLRKNVKAILVSATLVLASGLGIAAQEKPVELVWYTIGSPQQVQDQKAVLEEVNKILVPKIGATLTLVTLDWGAYNDKLKLLAASREPFDIAFTASWTNNYSEAVARGAFIPLDDLLAKYGQDVVQLIPKKYWDATRVNGKIYGVPNYQIMAYVKGVSVQKSLATKYKLDPSKIKSLADLEPFLAQVKKNEKDIVPFLPEANLINTFPFWDKNSRVFYDFVLGPLAVRSDDKNVRVINAYETQEWMNYMELLRRWYQKGYIAKDAASVKDYRAEQRSGRYAVFTAGNLKPGNEADTKSWAGFDVTDVPTTHPFLNTMAVLSTLSGISSTSKHPDKAMQLLNLINQDKGLYNLICHGIEGKHYTKLSDNVIRPIPEGGYNPGTDWEFGCQFNGYYLEGQTPGIWEETMKLNEAAQASPIMGFIFDPTAVKTQVAQINAILGTYAPGMNTGTIDPVKARKDLMAKLKAAGLDKVQAEIQKQIDAWRKGAQ